MMTAYDFAMLLEDRKRLEWLESKSNGDNWVARQSINGRGFRLHNTGSDDGVWEWPSTHKTAREAIDAAMKAEEASK